MLTLTNLHTICGLQWLFSPYGLVSVVVSVALAFVGSFLWDEMFEEEDNHGSSN